MTLSIRRSARAAKVDAQPKGKEALAIEDRSESTQALLQHTRRITRSTCKPGDLLDPGGPGSFIRKQSDKQQTAIRSSTASSGQQLLVAASAESERSSTQSFSQPIHIYDTVEFADSSDLEGEDFVEAFYRKVGYLAPLDDATLEAVEQFLDMDAGAATGRVSASNTKTFERGLHWRNVSFKTEPDPKLEELKGLTLETSPQNTPEEQEAREVLKRYHCQLWDQDLEKCKDHSQEATFQRTLLLSMIDRLNLIYGNGESSKPSLFDFAVETPWACPPMPTKAANKQAQWLTRPQPDLAVAFVRERIIPKNYDWDDLPSATQKLICYEGDSRKDLIRAFHFLTIEAKRRDIDDEVALNQSLNNASQALHNMYELFKEADTEIEPDKHEKKHYTNMFFDKIRVFSIAAARGGMKIRVHRACDITRHNNPKHPITKGYPLQFAYNDYAVIHSEDFKYHRVVGELSKIILGYGAGELKKSLESALEAVNKKFTDHRKNGNPLSRDEHYYSYGQVPSSTKKGKTPSVSVAATGDYASESTRARTARPSKDSSLRRSMSRKSSQLGVHSQGSQTDSFLLPPTSASPSPSSETSQQQDYSRGNKRRRV